MAPGMLHAMPRHSQRMPGTWARCADHVESDSLLEILPSFSCPAVWGLLRITPNWTCERFLLGCTPPLPPDGWRPGRFGDGCFPPKQTTTATNQNIKPS